MKTVEWFVEKSRTKHGDRFDYIASRYQGFTMPIDISCRQHGDYKTTPKSHLYSESGGCPQCRKRLVGNALRLTNVEFIERAKKIHGDYYGYQQVDYVGRSTPVTIDCPKHGPFRMKPERHLGGRGCRLCAFHRIGQERKLSFWDFVEQVITVHGVHRYEYDLQDCVNAHSKIPIRCPTHGLFKQSVASHLKGHGCPRCFQSNGEQQVREILGLLEVAFSEQVRFADCCYKRSLPFDFYVPDQKLLIEFDGRQHYDSSELWGGEPQLAETQLHDDIKTEYAAKHGYRLLRIPYWEYDHIEDILLEQLTQISIS